MNFDFKLCQNPDVDDRLRGVFANAFSSLRSRLETISPSAIVLTGSLSRGEGSAWTANGLIHLNSDLEMIIILSTHEQFRRRRRDTRHLAEEIKSCLKEERVLCKVECRPAPPSFLLKLRPTIFAYEFMTKGKVVWGDESVLSRIRAFTPNDIPRWDAFELINNRIIEHLSAFQNILSGKGCDVDQQEVAAYSLVKIYIDMATAILVFLRRYEPTYEARATRFQEVTRSLDGTPLHTYIPTLTDMVQRCTHFKLHQDGSALDFFTQELCGGQSESSDGHDLCNQLLLKAWERLSLNVRPVWTWMANEIAGGDYTEDIYTLVGRILKQESFSNKLKGWARLCLGLNRANRLNELQCFRLLHGLLRSSPENNIRCLGALLYFYIHGLRETENADDKFLSYMAQRMPSLSINSYRKIHHELLIREINYNYKKFIRRDYGLNPSCCS